MFLRLVPALILAFAQLACTGPQHGTARWENTGRDVSEDAPVSTNADAGAEFEAAAALYHDGRFREALEAFRVFGATHPTDPLAVRAEIYAARTQAALGETLAAESAFRSLYDAPDGPETRAAAACYVAFVRAQRGEADFAMGFLTTALGETPSLTVPSGWVVEGDEALLASLLAEARVVLGDAEGAMRDLATVAAVGDETLRGYAADRALELAPLWENARALQRTFDDGDPFTMAALAPELASLRLEAGDVDGAREVLLRAEEGALRWGRPERLAEVRERLDVDAGDRPLRYGVAVELTGNARRAGRAALGAVLLAQRSFEDRDARSTVVIRDTQGTEAGTRRAIEELADAGVSVIIGPVAPNTVSTARDAASRAGVPLIALSAVSFERGQSGTFRWLLSAPAEATVAVEAAVADGRNRFVVVQDSTTGAGSFLDVFAASARVAINAEGGMVVDALTIAVDPEDAGATQSSAREVARAIAATNADAVVLAVTDGLAATLAAHLAAEDVWPSGRNNGRRSVLYVGNSFIQTDVLLLNSSDYLEGAVIPVWFSPDIAEGAAREFADRFMFTFGRPAGTVEAFAFDAATAARRVLVDEGVALPADVADRLSTGVLIDGAVGPVRFDANGNPAVAPGLCTVSNGRFVAR